MSAPLADLEATVATLERQRAEIAAEHRALMRRVHTGTTGMDSELSVALRKNTDRGLELDRKRGVARRELIEEQKRQRSRAEWRATLAAMPEHREVCTRIAGALAALIPELEAERRMHEKLREQVGKSHLPDLRADIDRLKRLRQSVDIYLNATPERAA